MLGRFKDIFVSGGAGFIGAHMVSELLKNGFKLRVLDDLSTGKVENIVHHLNNPDFCFIKGDIRDKKIVNEALRDVKAVYHLAAISSVPFSVKNPRITFQINLEGTQNLLELSVRNEVEKFIFASTSAVYGDPVYLPIDEEHPTNPKSPYALTKLKAEQLCREFEEKYGLNVTILRLFNVYGPGSRCDSYGGVIAQFINRLRNNKPLLIYGDGTQTRDFVHVKDVVQAFLHTLSFENTSENKVFNIATGKPTTINELVRLLTDLTGKETKIKYLKARKGDIKHSYANIKKAERSLGYKPNIPLKEGLLTLINHQDDRS